MKDLKKEAEALSDALVRTRRRLHAFAECGFALPKTRDLVCTALKNMGYEPKSVGKGGIVAEGQSGKEGAPVVLLRADMDALPIREETRLPFRAENGCAHACGHDLHTTMLLGAAFLLSCRTEGLPFRVRFAFEAAEETLAGAKELLAADLLSDVQAAIALHVVPAVPYPTGTVILPPSGIGAPAAAFFTLTVKGESAHVGESKRGKDALLHAVTLYGRMREEAARYGEDFSLAVGRLWAGDAPNVVAGHARIEGTFRTQNEEKMAAFRAFLLALAEESPRETSLCFDGDCPPLLNDGGLLSVVQRMLDGERIPSVSLPPVGAAAEDFAHVSHRVPSLMLALAAGEATRGYERPLHHPAVLFDEDSLSHGASLYAMSALAIGRAIGEK